MNMHLTAVPLWVFMGQDISITAFSWEWAHGISGAIGMAGGTIASVVLEEGAIGLATGAIIGEMRGVMRGQITDQITDTATSLMAMIAAN
ncbi:MAG: hypothetical protein ABI076_02930 [Acidobacteriaceae bacterium]